MLLWFDWIGTYVEHGGDGGDKDLGGLSGIEDQG
jgi:hypothetical protein